MKPSSVNGQQLSREPGHAVHNNPAPGIDRDTLVVELEDRIARLNEQSRIFIPLIALVLIAAIPVWSKSAARFLLLLMSPFVLLPLGFCIAHLLLAWRRIAIARSRIRHWDRINERTRDAS